MLFPKVSRIIPVPTPDCYGATGGGRFWIGTSAKNEILGLTTEGELTTIVRGIWPPEEVTDRHRREWKEARLDGLSGDRRRRKEAFIRRLSLPDRYRLGFPDTLSHYPESCIWARADA